MRHTYKMLFTDKVESQIEPLFIIQLTITSYIPKSDQLNSDVFLKAKPVLSCVLLGKRVLPQHLP